MLYMPVSIRCCTKCGEWKLATRKYFYYQSDAYLNLRADCKECVKARAAMQDPAYKRACANKYRRENPEQKKAADKAWRLANLEHKRQMNSEWYVRNRERILSQKRRPKEVLPEGKKRCRKCNEILPSTSEFFPTREGKYRSPCKRCISAANRKPREQLPDGQKRCTKCKEVFPATVEYFQRKSIRKDGLNDWCKNCTDQYTKRRYYKDVDKTRERLRESGRRNRLVNPGARVAIKQRRRARTRMLPVAFTAQDWQTCLNYWGGCCAVCGRPAGLWHTLAADHWIAVSDPRPDNPGTVPANIVPLCHGVDGCNNSKADSDPIEWLIAKFGQRKAKHILAKILEYFASLASDDHG